MRDGIRRPDKLPDPTRDGQVTTDILRLQAELKTYFRQQFAPDSSASFRFAILVAARGPELAAVGNAGLLTDLASNFRQLDSLRAEQIQTVLALRQPGKYQIFWATPIGMLYEILFWSFFGIVTNLLFNASEHLRKPGPRTFFPVERWVGLTKLIYGPGIALGLCLAITVGLANVVGESVRVWVMPIIAFFFGFNVRKTAGVVDRASEQLLGKVQRSLDMTSEERNAAQRQAEQQIQAALPPLKSFAALGTHAGTEAQRIAREIIARYENRL
ncbi:MAG: hypothetical protein EXS35_09855 [Pedosphaera sp.]|nr:hypothetical protein [Pedosphaera sp.]